LDIQLTLKRVLIISYYILSHFRESDVISIHVPFSLSTEKLIDARELGWMKRDMILVNTWRGAVLDEVALIQCLKERKIACAGLDVFAQEPLDKNNPLKELDNAILASHTAALTQERVIRLAVEAVQSALSALEGKRPDGIVNPEVLTHPRWQTLL